MTESEYSFSSAFPLSHQEEEQHAGVRLTGSLSCEKRLSLLPYLQITESTQEPSSRHSSSLLLFNQYGSDDSFKGLGEKTPRKLDTLHSYSGDTEASTLFPERRSASEINDRSAQIRQILGVGDQSGINVVVSTNFGRTPFRLFLEGLTQGEFTVPAFPWYFAYDSDGDHDDLAHYDRLPEIHPDTATVVGSYAQECLDLLEAEGETQRTDEMGIRLDNELSTLGHIADTMTSEDGNILADMASVHYDRITENPDPAEKQEFINRIIQQQVAYSEIASKIPYANGKESRTGQFIVRHVFGRSAGNLYRGVLTVRGPHNP